MSNSKRIHNNSLGSFRFINKKNANISLEVPHQEKSKLVPTMEDTLAEVRAAVGKGDHLQGLKSMSKQWHSIKNFSMLYSTLNEEINKNVVDFGNLVQKFNETVENVIHNEKEENEMTSMSYANERIYSRSERQKRIKRYLEKKKRRKKKYFIRYEIRKTLANNRLRNKGKFIKNKKIDINKLIEMVKKGRSL